MEEPGFWDEPEESQKIMKNLKDLKDQVETVEHLEQSYEDIGLLIEMAYEEEDESVLPEIEEGEKVYAAIMKIDTDTIENTGGMMNILAELQKLGQKLKPMQELAERSPVTGRACCTACTADLQSAKDSA